MIKSILKQPLIVLFCLAACITSFNTGAQILYVKPIASGSGNGSSWANASADLQFMINKSISGQQVWVAAGTYKPSRPADNLGTIDANNRNNAFVLKNNVQVYGGFAGTEFLLSQRNWDTHPTILSGDIGAVNDNTDNCYHVVISAGEVGTARLDGFTVTRGNANISLNIYVNTEQVFSGGGGGMYNVGSSPILINCRFTNNNAINGGGMLNNYSYSNNISSSPVITNCRFSLNVSDDSGAGMYNLQSSAVISYCAFSENTAIYIQNVTGGGGGGIYSLSSSITVNGCIFLGNTATHGGGLRDDGSYNTRIFDCIFSGNTAAGYGGAIDAGYCTLLQVTGCIFKANIANTGGGMSNYSTSATITNCLFSGNNASGNNVSNNGGGIMIGASPTSVKSPTLVNCTFSGNTASNRGGGISNVAPADPIIANSIIWGNSANADTSIYASTNLTGVKNCIIEGGYATGTNILNTNPLFISTTTSNHRLQPNSPAIDAGNNAQLPFGITTDLDGNARIVGVKIDLGAYELPCDLLVLPDATGIVYVDSSKSGNGSSWANALPSLADALKAAKTNTAIQQIWVVKGTYYPYYDAATLNCTRNSKDNSFVLVNNVRLYGGFAGTETLLSQRNWTNNKTILSGDVGVRGEDNDNVYHVVVSAGAVGTARLDGFTVTGGNGNFTTDLLINGVNVNRGRGGGMSNVSSSPTIEHCIFLQNISTRGGGMCNMSASPIILNCDFIQNVPIFWGGGMYNNAANPVIKNCDFLNNTGSLGGGDVFGGGMSNDNSSPEVTACVFSGNSADFGGGIDNFNNASPGFYRCTFTKNLAASRGGGVHLETNAVVTLVNCLVSGNFAAGNGGGLNSEATALPVIINSTIAGNRAGSFGGGIMQVNTSAVVRNSIIWGNSAGTVGKSLYPLTGGAGVSYSLIESGYTSGNNILTGNPLLIDAVLPSLAPTSLGNYRVQECSPALNAGLNAYVPPAGNNDLDDNLRILNGTVDMGAYEKGISPQATLTWLGVNSNWNDVLNWCGNIVPAPTNNVIIPQGVANYPAIDASNSINDIRLDNSASISVTSTGQFTISGAYTNNGATIDNNGKWVMAGNSVGQIFPGVNGTVIKMKFLELRNSVGIRLDKSFEINDLKMEAGVNTVNSSVNISVKP